MNKALIILTRIICIVGALAVFWIMLTGSTTEFYTLGSIGGCTFIIVTFLDAAFPGIFKIVSDKQKVNK